MTGSDDVTVQGADELARSLRVLADVVEDLQEPDQKAGDLLLEKADPRTPRSSGQLAASGRVSVDSSGFAVIYEEVYAGVVHNGWPARNITPQPWLRDTVTEQTTAVGGVYGDYLHDAVARVRGA